MFYSIPPVCLKCCYAAYLFEISVYFTDIYIINEEKTLKIHSGYNLFHEYCYIHLFRLEGFLEMKSIQTDRWYTMIKRRKEKRKKLNNKKGRKKNEKITKIANMQFLKWWIFILQSNKFYYLNAIFRGCLYLSKFIFIYSLNIQQNLLKKNMSSPAVFVPVSHFGRRNHC